jgi:hypothetical protein
MHDEELFIYEEHHLEQAAVNGHSNGGPEHPPSDSAGERTEVVALDLQQQRGEGAANGKWAK